MGDQAAASHTYRHTLNAPPLHAFGTYTSVSEEDATSVFRAVVSTLRMHQTETLLTWTSIVLDVHTNVSEEDAERIVTRNVGFL